MIRIGSPHNPGPSCADKVVCVFLWLVRKTSAWNRMHTNASDSWILQLFVLLSLPRSKGDQVFFSEGLDEKDENCHQKLKVYGSFRCFFDCRVKGSFYKIKGATKTISTLTFMVFNRCSICVWSHILPSVKLTARTWKSVGRWNLLLGARPIFRGFGC